MKKLLSLLLLIAIILAIPKFKTLASEYDTIVTSEKVELVGNDLVTFSNVDFNLSNYISTGYTLLKMGHSTTMYIDMSTVLQYFHHYNTDNISSVYLEFDLGAVWTGVDDSLHQWLSDDVNWNKTTKRYSLGTSVPLTASVQIWWNVIGESGGGPSTHSGALRLYGIDLVIEYTNAIQLYTQISNWEDLPAGSKSLTDITSYQQLVQSDYFIEPVIQLNDNDKYDIYFDFDEDLKYVAKNITLPSHKYDIDLRAVYYFSTNDSRYLWIFYDTDTYLLECDYIIWNLLTGEYEEIVTDTIYGVPFVTGDGFSTYNMAYVDLVIPWKLDDIVSVNLKYYYRHVYLVGKKGEWNTVVNKNLYRGALTGVKNPWWNPFARLYYNVLLDDLVGDLWDFDQITVVNDQYDLSKQTSFVNYINQKENMQLTVNDVFVSDYTVGRIFLGQFDKFGSIGVEIKDIVLLNIRYTSNGQVHSIPYPNQVISDSPIVNSPFDKLTNALDIFWAFISKIWLFVCIIIGFYVAKLITNVLPYKYRKNVFIYAGIVIVVTIILFTVKP